MARFTRILVAALMMLALCAPIAFADVGGHPADHDDRPGVSARSATDVQETSATLRARIDPNGDDDDDELAFYRFQYGTTTGYGLTSGGAFLWGEDGQTVSIQVKDLSPGTTYHFRAVATNDEGTTYGPNGAFRTTGRAVETSGPSAIGEPALGRTVVAEVAEGTVLVRERGSAEFHPIDVAEEIPVNSTFDTSDGSVILKTAREGGASQTGTFWGGMFQVGQSRTGNGMTHLTLRGGSFGSCASRKGGRNRALLRKKKHPVRELWGKDKGGRFKTSGKGSVATVRGTEWYTADRCDGTLTRVTSGKVLVRERGTGRSKLLRRGQSFLARFSR